MKFRYGHELSGCLTKVKCIMKTCKHFISTCKKSRDDQSSPPKSVFNIYRFFGLVVCLVVCFGGCVLKFRILDNLFLIAELSDLIHLNQLSLFALRFKVRNNIINNKYYENRNKFENPQVYYI